MPGMDRKGPLGNGPLTGGRRGVCNQTNSADSSPSPGDNSKNLQQGRGLGRCQGGPGRGIGQGLGRGQKRGGNR